LLYLKNFILKVFDLIRIRFFREEYRGMNFVGQGILDLSRIRPTHCVFSAMVSARKSKIQEHYGKFLDSPENTDPGKDKVEDVRKRAWLKLL